MYNNVALCKCVTIFYFVIIHTYIGILHLDKTNSVESLPEMLTSDSEGSYVGVSSPRDLQSPDFTAGFHADKTEVRVY